MHWYFDRVSRARGIMKFLRSCLIGGVFFFALCLSADEAFVSAMKLARTLNVSVSWNPLSQTILFSKGEIGRAHV